MADKDEIHLNTDRARGGSTPGMTRYILAASLVLVIVVFAVLFIRGV